MTKTEILKTRLTPEEKELVREAAEILGITMSDFMRGSLLDRAKSLIAVNQGTMTREEMADWVFTKARDDAYSAST